MSFEGEFASYEPLRRLMESEKVKSLERRFRIRKKSADAMNALRNLCVKKSDFIKSDIQPDLILAIDGSNLVGKAETGYPGAEFGYVTIASVLIDLKKVAALENAEFIDPVEYRKTEKASTIESVFPGCNVVIDTEEDAKSSLRKAIYEELNSNSIIKGGETLLDTYEYLLDLKIKLFPNATKPKSPIEGVDAEMTYGKGIFKCPISNKDLYSTDALRLHELLNPGGSSGEMYGQIMSTMEKLWLVHILRTFEKKGWLDTLRRVAFVIDGPLAVFSTSSWLTKVISKEIIRINDAQKKINNQDLLIVGIEKTGQFFNHFEEIDTSPEGVSDVFEKQTALLLDDKYIKKNIQFSENGKPYGQDTYFGRKFFYKTASGQKIVPVACCFSSSQQNILTAKPEQFSRLADIMELLDKMASCRYPNSVSPLISAHAEAAIPLNLGLKLFDDIAKEIKKNSNGN